MSIAMIATGGTIASACVDDEWINVDGVEVLAAAVDRCGVDAADIVVEDVATGSSSDLSTAAMLEIAVRIRDALDSGAEAVVVSHGTDTIELTSFVTQLLVGVSPGRRPVVFTGSMRVHSDPDPDGPANLADAIATARSPLSTGREVLVCVDGRLHGADRIAKVDARSLDAFTSAPFDPVGTVVDGAVAFSVEPTPRPAVDGLVGRVPIVQCYPGIEAADLEVLAEGCDGLVVESFGDLNLPTSMWGPIHALTSRGVPVVVTSGCYTDRATSEALELLGAIGCGGLSTQRARLALMAALSTTTDRDAVAAAFAQFGVVHDPGPRRSRP